MKINGGVHFMGSRDCPYTFRGQKLVELRRTKLREIAGALKIPADATLTKNEILTRVISKLSAMGAESEISNV